MLSRELVKELQTIIKEDYGPTLPEEVVEKVGRALVDLHEILAELDQSAEPAMENNYDKHNNKLNGR